MLGYLAIHGGPCSTCSVNSSHQDTPLHRIAHKCNRDTVRYLVNKGAYDNIKDDDGVSEWEYTADCKLVLFITVCSQSFDQWLASFPGRPSFDHLQYGKTEGEGLGESYYVICGTADVKGSRQGYIHIHIYISSYRKASETRQTPRSYFKNVNVKPLKSGCDMSVSSKIVTHICKFRIYSKYM